MALVALTSCSGAPGSTTLALALAGCWPRRAVLVEADPDGGRLAARCGLPVRPGLVDLAAVTRSGHLTLDDLARVSQRTDGGAEVVVAHPAIEQTGSLLAGSGARMVEALTALDDVDVLIDAGRTRPASPALPLLLVSTHVVVVAGSRLEDVASLVHRRPLLERLQAATTVSLVVTAPGEHSAADVSQATGLPLVGVRPGRSSRRTSDRGRRREAQWVRGLASDLASGCASGCASGVALSGDGPGHGDGRPASSDHPAEPAAPVCGSASDRRVDLSTAGIFGLPSGPARPGPVPRAEVPR